MATSKIEAPLRERAELTIRHRTATGRALDAWLADRIATVLLAPESELDETVRRNLGAADFAYLDQLALFQIKMAEAYRRDGRPAGAEAAARLDHELIETRHDQQLIAELWALAGGGPWVDYRWVDPSAVTLETLLGVDRPSDPRLQLGGQPRDPETDRSPSDR